jgi:hypothetical protein
MKQEYSNLANNMYDYLMSLATMDRALWIDCYNNITGENLTVDDVEWEE